MGKEKWSSHFCKASISYDDLYQAAKEECRELDKWGLHGIAPYTEKQIYEIFKNNNAHDITKAVIKIADVRARRCWKTGKEEALDFLEYAKRSPLSKASYHTHLFHSSCLGKLQTCEAKIRRQLQKEIEKEEKEVRSSYVPPHL